MVKWNVHRLKKTWKFATVLMNPVPARENVVNVSPFTAGQINSRLAFSLRKLKKPMTVLSPLSSGRTPNNGQKNFARN